MRAAVEGPGVAAVVEADTGVVLTDEDVARVERVDGDVLAGLGAERAILGHAAVGLTTTGELVAATFGARDLHSTRVEAGPVAPAPECPGLVEQ